MDTQRNSLDFESDDEIKEDKRNKVQPKEIAEKLKAELSPEIARRQVAVRIEGRRVVIQLLEKATFASGYATMAPGFSPVLRKIAGILSNTPGQVNVSGHTDDVPISNEKFRSNWDLSSARAVTVLEALLRDARLEPPRFTASGHADTRPLVPNDSLSNRAQNRRVDISIVQTADLESGAEIDPLLNPNYNETLPPGTAGVP